MDKLRWLYPGMGIKRWLLLSFVGAALAGAGAVLLMGGLSPGAARHFPGLSAAFLLIGILMVLLGFRNTIGSLIEGLAPEMQDEAAEFIYRNQFLKRGPKIVVLGGGTGLSVLLRGLKQYTSNITAIVTVADDGGSSGRIRGELGVLPPGDIRNCLVALADKESLMEELFQYRFSGGNGLAGHSIGNLLIAAMSKITGNFETAIRKMSKVLAIRGQVLPATLKQCSLCSEMEDGTLVEGESNISLAGKKIRRVFLRPADCDPVPEALEAVQNADIIILGPGSLFTSIIPNLLIRGMSDAILKSPAVKVYVCNIMTQPGETDNFKASDHIAAIHRHSADGLLDYAIVNIGDVPQNMQRKYMADGAVPVKADIKAIELMKVKPIKKKLVQQTGVVRHEPGRLAAVIMELIWHLRLGNDYSYLPFQRKSGSVGKM